MEQLLKSTSNDLINFFSEYFLPFQASWSSLDDTNKQNFSKLLESKILSAITEGFVLKETTPSSPIPSPPTKKRKRDEEPVKTNPTTADENGSKEEFFLDLNAQVVDLTEKEELPMLIPNTSLKDDMSLVSKINYSSHGQCHNTEATNEPFTRKPKGTMIIPAIIWKKIFSILLNVDKGTLKSVRLTCRGFRDIMLLIVPPRIPLCQFKHYLILCRLFRWPVSSPLIIQSDHIDENGEHLKFIPPLITRVKYIELNQRLLDNSRTLGQICKPPFIDRVLKHFPPTIYELDLSSVPNFGGNGNYASVPVMKNLKRLFLSWNFKFSIEIIHLSKTFPNMEIKFYGPFGECSVLFWACSNGFIDVVFVVLQNPNEREKIDNLNGFNYQTALSVAVFNGFIKIVQLLVNSGADFRKNSYQGISPFLLAVQLNQYDIVRLFLERGANVNQIRSYDGASALWIACDKPKIINDFKQILTVKILLEFKADINQPNNSGLTPLMIAGFHKNIEVMKLLLQHGADKNMKDKFGRTVREISSCRWID